MVYRLFGAKPLPEPVLTYNQLDPWEKLSEIVIEIQILSLKTDLKMLSVIFIS